MLRTVELGVILAVGALAAVLVATNAQNLPSRSSSAGCTVSQLTAERAALAYLAGSGAGQWPTDLPSLTSGDTPVLKLSDGVSLAGSMTIKGPEWTLTMHGGGAAQPTFTCE